MPGPGRQFFRRLFFLGGSGGSDGALGDGGKVDFAMSGVRGGHAGFEFVCDLHDIEYVDSVIDLDFLGVETNSCHELPFSEKNKI